MANTVIGNNIHDKKNVGKTYAVRDVGRRVFN